MKIILVLSALLMCLTATTVPAVYFPHDAIREEQAQMLEQMRTMRAMMEARQAALEGVPAEQRQQMALENARMLERINRMIARAEEGQMQKAAPYNESWPLGSSLRSLFLRRY